MASVTGDFGNVIKRLETMNKKVQKDISKKTLIEGAKVVVPVMENVAPYDTRPNRPAGQHLRETLGYSEMKNGGKSKGNYLVVGSQSTDREIIERAYYQHYGTTFMVGTKWITTAFELSEKQARQKMKEVVIEELKNI